MGRLTEKDACGHWRLKGLPWKNLYEGTPITRETYEILYGALCKLLDYEETGLTPEEIEKLNDFEKSQVGKMLKRLNKEQRKHRWIPVEERLPEDDDFVLTTVSGIYNNSTFSSAIQLASYCEAEGWFVEGYPEWADPKVSAWQPLPEPYEGV